MIEQNNLKNREREREKTGCSLKNRDAQLSPPYSKLYECTLTTAAGLGPDCTHPCRAS